MDDLIAFLRARLDEDEQLVLALDDTAYNGVESTAGLDARAYLERAAAEVEAKRRILAQCEMWLDGHDPERAHEFPGTTGGVATLLTAVRLLALPYAEHPDYREEWRP